MLSGIGPADELREAGVEPRHELPGVGRNLQDHPYLTLLWEISRGADALRRRQAQAPARVGAAPQRAADLDGRPRSSPSSAPGRVCRRPTSSSTWAALYFENHGEEEFDGARDDDRAGARQPAGARPGVAALGRPARQAAHPHQLADRARRRRLDGRGHADGARDRRRGAARRGRRPRAQARPRRREPGASSRRRCASGSS